MKWLLILTIFFVASTFEVQAKPAPQADSFTSGSIMQPWGGNLGGSWSNPYGGFSSSGYGAYRYNNGLGFL